MTTTDSTILAIAPGTREIGWAVLQAENLLHCGVRTVAKRHFVKIARLESGRFIESLISRYEPAYLALEKRRLVQKNSGVLTVITEEVIAVSRANGLKISEYVSTDARARLYGKDKATKRNVSELLARRYPELQNYLRYENKWSELYYTKMFDAVAVAVVCYRDLIQPELDFLNP